ncbi:hypothetical protein [Heterosigma akashiwo virus 01]|jgi:hypothetical protein|uniref:Uncharacterized protein n=1 Tax=Heterosigma akashiwo virus 01 TaxID=97195 RepID=A0A1C9C5K1_HAV01|nr:hypothetical protein D1R72_gp225 [Heterosigma akashiwo virus 01]AOM63556.1 hypothetical protein [Heterosigma akashiwo virus 01]
MTNYKQNKNNFWENLTGEVMHLKWYNHKLKIIPINIFIKSTPYLNKNRIITKFENINYSDISQYNVLKTKGIVHDIINYIINVDHECKINDFYDKMPYIIGYDTQLKYRSFNEILHGLI